MSVDHPTVAPTGGGTFGSRVRKMVKRIVEPYAARIEQWLARRVLTTVREELAATREEIRADLETLVELTTELERVVARLDAVHERDARDSA
jgi:predicted nuclease of restriction endonuclease-like RecB superfamily